MGDLDAVEVYRLARVAIVSQVLGPLDDGVAPPVYRLRSRALRALRGRYARDGVSRAARGGGVHLAYRRRRHGHDRRRRDPRAGPVGEVVTPLTVPGTPVGEQPYTLSVSVEHPSDGRLEIGRLPLRLRVGLDRG